MVSRCSVFYVTIPKLGDLCVRTVCVGSVDDTIYTLRTVRYNTARRQCMYTLGFSRIVESIYLIGLIKRNLTFLHFCYRKTKHPDLFKWFCIETIKVCCPKGLFGPDCNSK